MFINDKWTTLKKRWRERQLGTYWRGETNELPVETRERYSEYLKLDILIFRF